MAGLERGHHAKHWVLQPLAAAYLHQRRRDRLEPRRRQHRVGRACAVLHALAAHSGHQRGPDVRNRARGDDGLEGVKGGEDSRLRAGRGGAAGGEVLQQRQRGRQRRVDGVEVAAGRDGGRSG